jgi:hypothetical protein
MGTCGWMALFGIQRSMWTFLGASEPGGGVRTGEVASTSYELGKEREPLIKKLDPHMQLERIKGAVPLN